MSAHPRLLVMYDQFLQHPAQNINIVLGELHALSEEELRSQWHELVKDGPLEKTKLNIRIVRAEQQCMVCFLVYHPNEKETACPQCKSVGAKILSGEEFYLELD
jgi:Zn finger protein HypA/HybF involved in hydrogenase expression